MAFSWRHSGFSAHGAVRVDDRLADQLFAEEHSEHFRAKEPFHLPGVEPGERPEVAVGREPAVRHQNVDVRVEVEKLARGLDEPHGPRAHGGTVEGGREVESQGFAGAASRLSQEPPVVAVEDPQALGDGEDHPAVGDVFEELLLGPVRPQELTLLVAARAQARR